MKIHVSRVPVEGLKDHASYDPTTMDMDRVDVQLREPLEVDAFIVKAERELVVNAAIRARLHLVCARCLEEFTQTLATDAVFSYNVQPTDIVDITDDVRQEIILAYPMIPVCQRTCKGLCSTCGQNLNLSACTHQAGLETNR
jgi:uncharacterized protein